MVRFSLSTGLTLLGLTGAAPADQPPGQRKAVLVELFTSEGCSSCPPADALLERLDRGQPIAGVEMVVLSEHVDYWNKTGWAGPYSSAASALRAPTHPKWWWMAEPNFSAAMHAQPSRRSGLPPLSPKPLSASPKPLDRPLSKWAPCPPGRHTKRSSSPLTPPTPAAQDVTRGENKGRRLHHVAIVKELKPIGAIDDRSGLTTNLRLEPGVRLIVFVQESGNGPVWGTAMRPASR